MRIPLFTAILLFFAASSHSVEYGAGVSFDTSSNMLLRPGSPSGTVSSLFGGASASRSGFTFSYSMNVGTVQHYDGLQFHRHTLELTRNLRAGRDGGDGQITFTLLGSLARYGEVSFLGGYTDLGGVLSGKKYLTESTLFRWEGTVRSRSFRDIGIENYREAEATLRLDRFMQTGTTLRIQVDGGVRDYRNIPSSPKTSLFDLTARVAQSLGPQTGAWIEFHTRRVRNEAVPDTASAYDRILFDDDYKSSSFGGTFNVKHLLSETGSVQFRTTVDKKRFGRNTVSSYWYLPQEGWDELEQEYAVTLLYQPRFLPSFIHPSLEVYHFSVDSSLSDLSYRTTGLSFGITLY